MARRYGKNTPDVLRRRQNVADQQAAAYQARLMPNPGTPAWSQGLETSTPFFDIATVGMGGGLNLLRKGIGRKLAQARARKQADDYDALERAYSARMEPPQSYFDDMRSWNREFQARHGGPDLEGAWAERLRYQPIKTGRGYPNRARNIAARREREYLGSGGDPMTEKQLRKIRTKMELDKRSAVARRRRMQGSMGDDL